MVRKTKQEAGETRSLLLDTAERVFRDNGVSRTSLNEIAEAAGLTRGAIYWHFKNKADLFDAMMQRVTLPMEQLVGRAGDDAIDDPVAFIRACAINVLVRTATDEQMQRVFEICCHKCEFVGDMLPTRDRQLECRNDCLAQVEIGIRHAIDKGHLPAGVNPRRAAIGMHALIDGLIANWVLDPAYFPLAQEAEALIDIYLTGLGAKPAAAAAATASIAAATGKPRLLPHKKSARS
jgi:TetR/AcrR family transcriptional regulator, acrAB operon repressor